MGRSTYYRNMRCWHSKASYILLCKIPQLVILIILPNSLVIFIYTRDKFIYYSFSMKTKSKDKWRMKIPYQTHSIISSPEVYTTYSSLPFWKQLLSLLIYYVLISMKDDIIFFNLVPSSHQEGHHWGSVIILCDWRA